VASAWPGFRDATQVKLNVHGRPSGVEDWIMELEGTVHNGVILLETGSALPEGTRVTVIPRPPVPVPPEETIPTILERYGEIVGIAPELPADMAEHHDHYIHGTPKP